METIKENKNISLDSWEGLLPPQFIKAENIKGKEAELTVIDAEIISRNEDNTPQVCFFVEYGGTKYRFGLNKANSNYLRDHNIVASEVIGKILKIIKVKTRNPTLNKEVDGLRIDGVRD